MFTLDRKPMPTEKARTSGFATVLGLHLLFAAAGYAMTPIGAAWPFEENGGRFPPEVAFHTRTGSGTTFVTASGAAVHLLRGSGPAPVLLIERFAQATAAPRGETPSATRITYFRGTESGPGRSLAAFTRLRMQPWPGIEAVLQQRDGAIERVFELAPGSDVDAIEMQLEGAEGLTLAGDGTLEVATPDGAIRFSAPVAWQPAAGGNDPVAVAFRIAGTCYGFALGPYDPARPVIIDPLLRSTYNGGTGGDQVRALAADATTIYAAGQTASSDYPVTPGAAQTTWGASTDAFVARYSADLTQLLAATYFGGNGTDIAHALLLADGAVFVAGRTQSTDLPGTTGSAQSSLAGDVDGFVARLSPDLSTLARATYFGGTALDLFFGAAASATDLYATGFSQSSTLPGTTGAAQPARSGASDAIAARFSLDLTTLVRATFLGGSGDETGRGRPLVLGGSLYLAGATDSHDFPQTAGGAQPSLALVHGNDAGFVSQLSLDLATIAQSTYYATTSSTDLATSLATVNGDVFVLGESTGTDLPGTAGGALAHAGLRDLFVARLSADLGSVVNATYFGGSDDETAGDLVIDGSSLLITGTTPSTNLPGTATGVQATKFPGASQTDVLLARFDLGLTSLERATYLGGTVHEEAYALTVLGANAYVGGRDDSAGFPGTGAGSGGAQESFSGGLDDGFVAALSSDLAAAILASVDDVSAAEGNAGTTAFVFTVTISASPAAPATINLALADLGTQMAIDYLPLASTQLIFTPQGPLSQTVTVQVVGDLLPEGDEDFQLVLSSNDLALADAAGLGTIIDDDNIVTIPTLQPLSQLLLALLLGAGAWFILARRARVASGRR